MEICANVEIYYNILLLGKCSSYSCSKEKLQLESYTKTHFLSNMRFCQDEERAKKHSRYCKAIKKRISEIENEVKKLED